MAPAKVNRQIAAPGCDPQQRDDDGRPRVRAGVDLWEESNHPDANKWFNMVMTQPGRPPLETRTIRQIVSEHRWQASCKSAGRPTAESA